MARRSDNGEPRLRGEAAAAALRAQLKPFEPGERPAPVLVACALAAALALANIVPLILGVKLKHYGASTGPTVVFAAVMVTAAIGMWQLRYWAVLGFEALLVILILFFTVFLMRASNIEGALLCVAIIGFGGWLFWKLVRVMARIQLPGSTSAAGEDTA